MKRNGFTLMEVIISCGILSLFMAGLMTLYFNGSKMGNSAMWLQNTTNKLKIATRQINTSIRKSSYPSKIIFPKTIIEAKQDCFKLKYFEGQLFAKDSASGIDFLIVTEATPARSDGDTSRNRDGELYYHVYSLSSNGDLTYILYKENVSADTIKENYTTKVPNGTIAYKSILVKDVEYIKCGKKDNDKEDSLIQVTISCSMPRHETTRRSEIAVAKPNVDIIAL